MVSGILFYAWGEPFYVIIMLVTVAVDYIAGRLMDRYDENQKARLWIMLSSVALNLSFLVLFKYGSFIVANINALFGTQIFDPKLPLPIGISFYTFQAMSYTIDLYKRNIKVQKSFINFTGYVTLFPQLIAGPIVRYSDIENEINTREISNKMIADGISIFIRGLGKKVLLANSIGALWTTIKAMDYATMPALTAWVGILAFTFQIYYDFSGYSDMAIGLGKMLGFHFPKNFDHPYMSKSISEFWRRWHITLGSWFKSYVYIPMGGNRGSTLKVVCNLFVVWLLTGLWHGASWNFVLWGIYFGGIIIIEKLFLGKLLQKIPSFIQWIYSFLLVVFGWVLFEMRTLGEIGSFFAAMFGLNNIVAYEKQSFYLISSNILVFVVCAIGSTTALKHYTKPLEHKSQFIYKTLKLVCEFMIFAVCICYLVTSGYNPFLYFNF